MSEEACEREDLLTTARVFLETQGQIGETAKRLFIHRNTVTYRLGKFERLTRRSLRAPSDSLRLRTIFLIREAAAKTRSEQAQAGRAREPPRRSPFRLGDRRGGAGG